MRRKRRLLGCSLKSRPEIAFAALGDRQVPPMVSRIKSVGLETNRPRLFQAGSVGFRVPDVQQQLLRI